MTDKIRIKKFIQNNRKRFTKWGDAAAEKNLHNSMEANDLLVRFCDAVISFIDSLQEEPVSKVWHDSNEEPNNMSHCLVFYGDKSFIGHYLHYEPVLYNKQDKVFVTVAYPHPTGYKVEQKSLDGGCVAEVYKDKRERISISDITSWCYLNDLHNLTQKEEPVAPKVLEDMLNAKTAAESLGISQEEHDRIVDELIYGKELELVDDLPNKEKEPVSEDLEKSISRL